MRRSEKYEKALGLAQSKDFNTTDVLDLLNTAIKEGDARASYALGSWYLHGTHVRRSTKKAFSLIREAAREGHADALYDLAVFYESGVAVEEDLRQALALYMASALRGNAQAHYEVGRLFWHGIGVEPDKTIAEIWLDRAEELGINDRSLDLTH